MTPISGIYLITFSNSKQYVGQAKNIQARVAMHKWQAKTTNRNPVYAAMRKYEYTVAILEECSEEFLDDREVFWIKELNTLSPNGYNLTTGGGRPKMSDETRRKMSEARKGKKRPESFGQHLSLAKTGMTYSSKGRPLTEKEIEGRKQSGKTRKERGYPGANLGKTFSEEHRKKISEALKGKPKSAEHRQALSEARKKKEAIHG